MNPEKLAALQKGVRIGGKGAPRRKIKRAPQAKPPSMDEKKIQSALKKLNVQNVDNIEEVNLFKEDGTVIHITQPKVQASVYANTFAVQGRTEEKELTDMLPNVLGQLGSQSTQMLQKVIEKMGGLQALQEAIPPNFPTQNLFPSSSNANASAGYSSLQNNDNGDDDDDVPELVQNFDEEMD